MRRQPIIREDRWYVVRVHPGCELVAARHLEEQAYGAFAPTFTPEGKTKEGKPFARKPLFPGYIFAKFDIAFDRWQPINNTRGVMHLLPQSRETPLPIPTSFVERIRDQVEAGDFEPEQLEDILKEFVPGLPVEIVNGPFFGFPGVVSRRKGKVIEVEVALFGRPTPVRVGVEDLKRPKPAAEAEPCKIARNGTA